MLTEGTDSELKGPRRLERSIWMFFILSHLCGITLSLGNETSPVAG